MDLISKRLANDRFYAYHDSRFWFWDEARNLWKESHLMAKKYDLNHAVDKLLSPEDFLSDPSQFHAMEDYELDFAMKDALRNAKPCQTAPIEPVETPAQEAAAPAAPDAPALPAFDFSALGELSGQAEEADRQFDLHYGTAQDEYLISCIYLAKVHALTARAGRYGGGTWTKWYESKGLSEGSVRTMVKNGDAFKSANVAELKSLPELTRKDLALIARSGCADQLVANARNSQKVQQLIDRLRADVAAATQRADAAIADVNGLKAQNDQLRQSYNTANEDRIAANLQRQKAEAERDKAETRAKAAEDALKNQPITAVVDAEEVDRLAAEKALGLADARNRELQEENDRLRKSSTRLERQMKALNTRMSDLDQTDFETANHCAAAMRAIWDSCKGSYSRLNGEDQESTFQFLCNTLNGIREEAALLRRQPDSHEGGEGTE